MTIPLPAPIFLALKKKSAMFAPKIAEGSFEEGSSALFYEKSLINQTSF